MKRLFTLLFSIAFICQAFGYDIEINGIYYYVTSDENRTLEVTSGTNCYTGEVIISTLVPYSGSTYRVTSISDWAFWNCKALTNISIPIAVTSIGESAFGYCCNLTDVYVNWSEPLEIPSSVFYDVDLPKATLHVPTGTKALYEAADVWKDFGTIVEDEGNSLRSVKDNKASDGLFYRLDGTRYNAVPAKGQILIQWGKKGRIASGL